ncbi:GvpL/GvpF family gas vesicle protein [Kribbella sp. CA-253562]|uniref:GvpL/GvpF family gas vesicle protein n=1 Tax=Kribbella sp. CA-253562 TaxID=3239942 RepID=UPI003D8E30F4
MTVSSEVGVACYVYGITVADLRLPDGLTGIGDQPVAVVPYGEVAAVTSAVDPTQSAARRADLVAHSKVLDAVAAAGPVVPIRFGSILVDRSAVLTEVLEPSHDRFRAMLDELAGYLQFTVRARYDERQVLTEVVAGNPEIALLRAETREHPEESSYGARVRLGELVAAALEEKRAVDGEQVLAMLEPFAAAVNVREGAGLDQLIDVAFLVEEAQRAAFERAAEQVAKEFTGRARIKLVGPSPAYDFVDAEG